MDHKIKFLETFDLVSHRHTQTLSISPVAKFAAFRGMLRRHVQL